MFWEFLKENFGPNGHMWLIWIFFRSSFLGSAPKIGIKTVGATTVIQIKSPFLYVNIWHDKAFYDCKKWFYANVFCLMMIIWSSKGLKLRGLKYKRSEVQKV